MSRRVVLLMAVTVLAVALSTFVFSSAPNALADNGSSCRVITVSDWGNGHVINEKWDPAPAGDACLSIVWGKPGTVLMAGGVFTAPLTHNGQILPTQMMSGQLAPQIVQFRRNVSAGERWELRPTWMPSGTEIYLGFDYVSNATPTPTQTPTPTSTPSQTPEPLWPCEGSRDASTSYEIDKTFYLSLEPGQAAGSFAWKGNCPTAHVESVVPVPYTENYRIRIVSDEALGKFYTTSGYQMAMGYAPTRVQFDLFVPDDRLEEFRARDLDPTPFSKVENWGRLVGASPTDRVAQWVTRWPIELGGIYHYRTELVFGLVGVSPNPVSVFMAWEKPVPVPQLYLPIFMKFE